jgi:hypothetical protein
MDASCAARGNTALLYAEQLLRLDRHQEPMATFCYNDVLGELRKRVWVNSLNGWSQVYGPSQQASFSLRCILCAGDRE